MSVRGPGWCLALQPRKRFPELGLETNKGVGIVLLVNTICLFVLGCKYFYLMGNNIA